MKYSLRSLFFLKKETYTINNLKHVPLKKVYMLLVVCSFILSLFVSLYASVFFFEKAKTLVTSLAASVVAGYPQELILTVKDGVLTKNLPGKYSLYPAKYLDKRSPKAYLVAIDDTVSASVDAFLSSSSSLLLAKDGIVIQKSSGYEISPYQKGFNFEISKAFLENLQKYVLLYIPKVWMWGIAIFILYSLLLKPLLFMVGILGISAVVYYFRSSFFKEEISFSRLYAVTLFLSIPAFILKTLLFYVTLPSGYLVTCVVTVGTLWYVLKRKGHVEESKEAHA